MKSGDICCYFVMNQEYDTKENWKAVHDYIIKKLKEYNLIPTFLELKPFSSEAHI